MKQNVKKILASLLIAAMAVGLSCQHPAYASNIGNIEPEVEEVEVDAASAPEVDGSELTWDNVPSMGWDDPEKGKCEENSAIESADDFGIALFSWEEPKRIKAYGVDVSVHNGTIDWQKVKAAGVDFAFIRVGGRGYVTGILYKDDTALQNIEGALAAGIKVGVYFFSTAINEQEALEEAQYTCNVIKDYNITYPVVFDHEGYFEDDYRNNTKYVDAELRTKMAVTFLNYVEEQGYQGMMYSSSSHYLDSKAWDTSSLQESYDIWVAQYPLYQNTSGKWQQYTSYKEIEGHTTSYIGNYRFWQFTSDATLVGINGGNVDLNIEYYADGEEGASPPVPDPAPSTGENPTTPTEPETPALAAYTTTAALNYRTGPGTSYSIAGTLSNGAKVQVVTDYSTSADGYTWYKIYLNEKYYYATSKYLQKDASSTTPTEPETPAEPTTPTEPETPALTGYTTTASLNYRTGPGTSYSVAGTLSKGAKVQAVTDYSTSADGYTWYKIYLNGKYYYATAKYLQKDGSSTTPTEPETPAEPTTPTEPETPALTGYTTTAALNYRTGPGTSYSVAGTLSKGAKVQAVTDYSTSANGYTWYKIYLNGKYYYATAKYLQKDASSTTPTEPTTPAEPAAPTLTGYTTTAALNYRTGPGTSYSVAGTLSKGAKVQAVTDYSTSANGYTWYKIYLNGKYYYATAKYLQKDASSTTPTEPAEPATPTFTSYTTTAALNYRTGPGTSYSVAGTLSKGAKVQAVSGYSTSANGYTWYKIYLNGKYYYVSAQYLQGASSSTTPALTRYITTVALNYRTGPGTTYSIVGTLSKGTSVQVVSDYSSSANGYTWYKIYMNGKYYYVSASYLVRS